MNLEIIAVVAAGMIVFGIISGRLRGSIVTPPLVFILFGFVIGPGGTGVAAIDPDHGVIHLIAEVTLVLVLFADAARINVSDLRRHHDLPQRMLLIGLPLTVAAGGGAAWLLFPGFSIWEAALLAAILAPTDAALGQAVVSNPAVPVRIRQCLNVESGLNDGIVLPAVLLFAAFASVEGPGTSDAADWVRFGLLQVALGPLVGIAAGYVGGRLIDRAATRASMSEAFEGIAVLALAFLSFSGAELIGGNGFIAAFVAGLIFGNTVRNPCTFLFEFMETEGQLLMLITFLVFGAALLPEGLAGLDLRIVGYAVLSLTVIRALPVAVSLLGTGIRLPTYLFLGWFGPRGLASILFALLILEQAQVPHAGEIVSATVITVALSALFHGLSAAPSAAAYGRLAARMGECEETRAVSEMPLRDGSNAFPSAKLPT